jgi:hypothetical protein
MYIIVLWVVVMYMYAVKGRLILDGGCACVCLILVI